MSETATTLCRVLIGLDRAAASGTLTLRSGGQRATLAFVDGEVTGANVDRRVASSHRQLLEGLSRVSGWDGVRLQFVEEPVTTTWWQLPEPVPARALSLTCIRQNVRSLEAAAVRVELGAGMHRLTSLGEDLLCGATLRPEERALVFWLRRGVDAEEVQSLPGCGLRGYRFLCALKLLRAAAPRACGSYPLLLRKRRELRSEASARKLLDLPEDAREGDARRALRRLVRHLHPDRFGHDVPDPLRRASAEVVTALLDAESELAAGH